MKATIGIYDSHEKAIKATHVLKDAGFPLKHVSILGHAEIVDDHLQIKSKHPREIGMSVGVTAGMTLGILSGVGIFTIPGFGFLYGAGALVGAIAGFDFGLIGGTILGVLGTFGIKDEEIVKYDEHLKNGKYLLIIQGPVEEINEAKMLLHSDNSHSELAIH